MQTKIQILENEKAATKYSCTWLIERRVEDNSYGHNTPAS